ncbi:MAG: ATP-binding cassette domain-containing protein [Hymenobacteraceae bacterium]|nr:ATP-binding cassette domain-containing protein [Hymenobacteraceae bacterium]
MDTSAPLLSIRHVSKQYATHCALDDVSFDVPAGTIFGLLGPNGAGKTSLIRTITQITAPDAGEIWFRGERLNPSHISRIGYLPEERGLYKKMQVGEQLVYLARPKGLPKTEAVRRIQGWLDRLDFKGQAHKNVEDLSKGMQQKVQFIATVVHEPELLILDEPFSGFDPINANLIKDEILELRRRGTTIIFSTHRMESVEELCDHIALLNRSRKVLDGPVKEIRNQFRSNTFVVSGTAPHPPILAHPDFEVIEQDRPAEARHEFRLVVRLLNGASPNTLLKFLLERSPAQVTSLQELVPSINDIFIRTVREGNEQ